jgi:hypothetical protein
MIRQPRFAAKCVKVGGLKEARDRNIGGSMSGCRGILLLDVCLWQSVFKNPFRATGGIFCQGDGRKFPGAAGAFLRERIRARTTLRAIDAIDGVRPAEFPVEQPRTARTGQPRSMTEKASNEFGL